MWAFPTQEEPSITLKTPSRAEKFPSGYAQIVEQEMPIWVTLA